MSEQITHSLVFIRAFISALGQSSGITFTPFGWTAAPQHPRARKKKSKGIQPWHLILFVVLERNFLLEKEKEGHEYERLPSCEGLKIEHVLSHLFVFYSQNNSFLIAFFFRAGVSFFTWRTRNAFFSIDPFKVALVVVLNGTPRADPGLTKPATSHCLGTFYLPLCYRRLFCFVTHPLTHHKAKYGPALHQYGPD